MQTSQNITARIGRWSTQHRNAAILGWLGFVLAAFVIGMNLVPQKTLDPNASGPGETGQAAKAMDGAFPDASNADHMSTSTGGRRSACA
jgi:uncharacterized membrane protein YdfJ with MMPL/SSD domain